MPTTTYGAPIIDAIPDCLPGLPADVATLTVEEFRRRYPPNWGVRAPAPHLVIEGAPSLEQLHTVHRGLARNNQLPRDGLLVCAITSPDGVMDADVFLWEHRLKFRSMLPHKDYQPRNGNELGRIDGWILEAALR